MSGVPDPDDTTAASARSRRQVLRLGGLLVGAGAVTTLAGCRLQLEQDAVVTPPAPTADELARRRAAADADRLLELIGDARRLRLDAAAVLGRIATDHQAHLAALVLPASVTTPSPKPTAGATASATATPAMTRASALAVLAAAETSSAARVRDDLQDVSGDLARLLGSIGASLDCHADALGRVRKAAS